nr:lyase family protein [Bradyrhizobium pachyrhizi]
MNTEPDYASVVVEELSRLTQIPFLPANDLIDACWDTGLFVLVSGILKRTATELSKILNDLRLLSSNPGEAWPKSIYRPFNQALP